MTAFIEKYLSKYDDTDISILDIGSQNVGTHDKGTYRHLFDRPDWKYCGLDVSEGENVDIVIDDYYNWSEIPDNSYDVIISGQALEHIEYVWLTMKEVARILKTGGYCCLIAPSKGPEHKYPLDCWRILPDGMKALAKYANLSVLDNYISNEEEHNHELNLWHDNVLICQKRFDSANLNKY